MRTRMSSGVTAKAGDRLPIFVSACQEIHGLTGNGRQDVQKVVPGIDHVQGDIGPAGGELLRVFDRNDVVVPSVEDEGGLQAFLKVPGFARAGRRGETMQVS